MWIMKIYKIASKNTDDFTYGETNDLWRELIYAEQNRVGIEFDLENDDTVEEMKTVNLDFKHKDYFYRVRAVRCQAGGDWEASSSYFRCQVDSRYDTDKHHGDFSHEYKCIVIPVKGNVNLIKKDGKYVAKDSDDHEKFSNSDIRTLWDELKKEIPKRIKAYYGSLDYDTSFSDQFKAAGLAKNLMSFWTPKR